MTRHVVKSWPWLFQPIKSDVKTHDLRDLNDRDYKVGDEMLLREFDPRNGQYTGDQCLVRITYMTDRRTPCAMSSTGLANNLAVLSIRRIDE